MEFVEDKEEGSARDLDLEFKQNQVDVRSQSSQSSSFLRSGSMRRSQNTEHETK